MVGPLDSMPVTELGTLRWDAWLAKQQALSSMCVEEVPLSAATDWGMQGGASYGRHDGKFFSIVGTSVQVPKKGQREVMGWNQPLIKEVGSGVLVLLKLREQDLYLVQSKAEPGNGTPGRVLLAPTIQASKSNLSQAHGGSLPPRAEFVSDLSISWIELPKDGGRFYESVNQAAIVDVDLLEPRDNERWFTRDELREALRAGVCNAHLWELLGLAFV